MIIKNPRTSVLSHLIGERFGDKRPRVLVVGCGTGIEAAVLSQDLSAEVIGIDLDPRFDPEAARYATLTIGDATDLVFPNESFDIVYSYHALEHIPDYHKALDEMNRVLKVGGLWCIGTPNRARLLGYLGGNSTFRQKISWNFADWRMRLSGRFRNEYGAHAGYTSGELRNILVLHFSGVEEMTSQYYRRLYSARKLIISVLIGSKLDRLFFPSIYFLGRKSHV